MKTSAAYGLWKSGDPQIFAYVLDGADSYTSNHSMKESMRGTVTKCKSSSE